jgi:hypothetical protein
MYLGAHPPGGSKESMWSSSSIDNQMVARSNCFREKQICMLILKKEMKDFSVKENEVLSLKHVEGRLPVKGGMEIIKDFPESNDWHIAEIAQVLNDRFVVNGYITEGIPLANYKSKSWKARKANLETLMFHRTWCVNQEKGKATIIPLAHLKGQQDYFGHGEFPY